jgi:hypothetical protein
MLHKSNHRYIARGCGNSHIADHSIIKIGLHQSICKYQGSEIFVSRRYLSRHIKQPHNSQDLLFLILAKTVIDVETNQHNYLNLKYQRKTRVAICHS